MKKSYLLDELDKTLALAGAMFSLALIICIKILVDQLIYMLIGILCFMVCTVYLIIRRFFYPSLIPSLDELKGSNRFYISLNILFFLFLTYSIISIYLRPDPNIRPLSYFISTALLVAIVSNEILFLSHQKLHICFALCKIIIIGLSLVLSQILIFPNVVGIDPWYHQWFTLNLINKGYIPESLVYSKLPLMHLMIGMTSLVTDLGYKMSTMISISFLQIVCDTLFVFLLGKFLISTKAGLLAALLLEVANHHIFFSFSTTPNTMAATLILPILFLLLKIRRDKSFTGTLVVMFLMGTLILTHTVTAMCMTILFYAFSAGYKAYNRLFNQETGLSVTWTICILFSTSMLAYWSYISGHIITLSNFIKYGFRDPLFNESSQYLSNIPFWEQAFNYLGIFIFFSLSLIGCFYMMSKQFRNSNRFANTIGGIVTLCLAFFPLITGKDIITNRWYYFSQILMAIPLSLSLLLLNGIFKKHIIKGFILSISVLILSFILIMNPQANTDNHLFSPNIGVRYAFTESELSGMETTSKIWNGMIGGDYYTNRPYELNFNREVTIIDDSLYTGDFSDMQGMLILVREEILTRPFITTSIKLKLNYDLCLALDKQNFSRIYDCTSLIGYADIS